MEIKVNRTITTKNHLVFTIVVTDPHNAPFSQIEKGIMKLLDQTVKSVESISPEENKTKTEAIRLVDAAKKNCFGRLMTCLKFSIKNQLQPKFDPMCQEIYNWIYNAQEAELKEWLETYDPQRCKYYFDNDPQNQNDTPPEFSEDKIDEDDEEDDE